MKTILFDLDGTLLPIRQEGFTREYFKALCAKICPLGYGREEIVRDLWAGTHAMYANDGSATNREVFWRVFGRPNLEGILDEFYSREFEAVRSSMLFEVDRRPLIDGLKRLGYELILATNPLFPASAVATRLSWIGLEPSDFAHITTYANSRFCKPNPAYFLETLAGREPADCMMVGNDLREDTPAAALGVDTVILTDCLEGQEMNGSWRCMSFGQLERLLLGEPD